MYGCMCSERVIRDKTTLFMHLIMVIDDNEVPRKIFQRRAIMYLRI